MDLIFETGDVVYARIPMVYSSFNAIRKKKTAEYESKGTKIWNNNDPEPVSFNNESKFTF